VIDQDAPHGSGDEGTKSLRVPPRDLVPVAEPDIRFVHESRRVERMVRAFPPQVPVRDLPQIFVQC
jgi:hypothetical protein